MPGAILESYDLKATLVKLNHLIGQNKAYQALLTCCFPPLLSVCQNLVRWALVNLTQSWCDVQCV